MQRYRPVHGRQANGTSECAAFAMARLIDRQTLGGSKPTPLQVRKGTNEPIPDPASPGLQIKQVADMAKSILVAIGYNGNGNWPTIIAGVREGRGFVVPGRCSALTPANRPSGYLGAHAVYFHELVPGEAKVIVSDSLRTGYVEWSLTEAKAYWDAYGHVYAYSRVTPL